MVVRICYHLIPFFERSNLMAVTTLRQMRQITHNDTEIDDSFKSELLLFVFLPRSTRRLSVFVSFKKESNYGHEVTLDL